MIKYSGRLLKLESEISADSQVMYYIPLGLEKVLLNSHIGKNIVLRFTGDIYCIATGEKIKKSYGQGYSYKAFISLAQCDLCIVKPETCHYHLGTCREPSWGLKNCFQPHYIYLSETSNVKVGITRQNNVPTRWIDQGAVQVIKLFKVASRLDAGLHEISLSQIVEDKTDWRKMLKSSLPQADLVKIKNELLQKHLEKSSSLPKILDFCDDTILKLNYPGRSAESLASLSFDKDPLIKGKLIGIKGQYLIFEDGVLNMRKFQGYELELLVSDQ